MGNDRDVPPTEAEINQRMSEYALKLSSDQHERYFDLGNWILATLVAINGAAIVALSNLDLALLQKLFLPAALYVGGVVAAVLSGFCHRGELDRLSALRFFNGIYGMGSAHPDVENDRQRFQKAADRLSTLSNWLNALSLLAFVAGCIAAGSRIAGYSAPQPQAPVTTTASAPK